ARLQELRSAHHLGRGRGRAAQRGACHGRSGGARGTAMSEPREPSPVPEAIARKPGPRSLQAVWIIPIVAAIVGGWLALKAFLDTGPIITIEFKTAEGIEPGKTRIKNKSVDVGTVKSVTLTKDRKGVLVKAEMDRHAAEDFLVDDTRFWVVRPRVAGGQVSGLGTLLAGSYIGSDPGQSSTGRREFIG